MHKSQAADMTSLILFCVERDSSCAILCQPTPAVEQYVKLPSWLYSVKSFLYVNGKKHNRDTGKTTLKYIGKEMGHDGIHYCKISVPQNGVLRCYAASTGKGWLASA